MQRTPDTVRSIDDCTTAFKPRCLVQSSSENDTFGCRSSPKTRDRSRQFQRKPMAIDCITMLVHRTDGVIKRMQDGTANKLHLPRRC
ncbi:hypothetical protein AOU36_21495 [Salmonella enterica]|nr:hypothetical protein [Salmonella enterica]